ncbi:MAG: hypothetical protein HFE76_00970 [Firmicutes bacterium]|nr:hypothetical protein [Bacillota bacterium]
MKVFKVLLAIILSIGLLCAQGVLMGILACDKSISQESITESFQTTDLASQLYEEALRASQAASSQARDPQAAQMLQKAMQTDTVSEFIGEYAADSIDALLHGENAEEFTKEDLSRLTSDSLDELSSKSGISIPQEQRQIVKNYINENADDITAAVNQNLPSLANTNPAANAEARETLARLQIVLGPPVIALLSVVCLVLGILLVMLFWRSKLGFAWWAAVSFLLASVFFFLGNSSGLFSNYIQETGDGDAAALFVTSILQQGFTFSALCGFGLTALLVVVCLVLRKVVPVRHRRY